MHRRRAPLRIDAIDQRRQYNDPFADVQLSKIVKEFSFVRINIDEVNLEAPNPFIQKLSSADELNGFFLEYSFPCLDSVSKPLKSTVRLPNKTATSTSIGFKHKRVALITMHPDQIAHWQSATLTIHLLVGMISLGKYTIRPLARCIIHLNELLLAPYLIHRDFEFEGTEFEGFALIRIDLGCRNKVLMEKLDALREDRSVENTVADNDRHHLPARRTRSRSSSSRCQSAHSHRSSSLSRRHLEENENRVPHLPHPVHIVELGESSKKRNDSTSSFRRTSGDNYRNSNNHSQRPCSAQSSTSVPLYDRNFAASTSSLGSDSVFRTEVTTNNNSRNIANIDHYNSAADKLYRPVFGSYNGSRSSSVTEEVNHEGRCNLQLTVHGAEGLPPVCDEFGRLSNPSTFISVLGREGDLRSEVIPNSRSPNWNWTVRFTLSSERRNLVIKVLHRSTTNDIALGFVCLNLPISSARKAVFELTTTTETNKFTSSIPVLVISFEKVRELDQEDLVYASRRSSSSRTSSIRQHQSAQSSLIGATPRMDSPILESSELIAERMRRDLAELDSMVRRFKT